MIVDCFTFFNELELLEIRLNELNPWVDKFVLVEGTVTYTNKKKKLFYYENKKFFKSFNHKITHVVVEDSPNVFGNPWIIEEYQFNAITRGLSKCAENDIILLSCVDEIPNKETRNDWSPLKNNIIGLNQRLFYYYLNLEVVNQPPWVGTRIVRYADINQNFTPYIIRHSIPNRVIHNGGWHFSFMGGAERIREKIFSYSHQEFNNPRFNTLSKIKIALSSNRDLFHRGFEMKISDLNTLPDFVVKNAQRYKKLKLLKSDGNKENFLDILFIKFIDDSKSLLRKILSKMKKSI